ncbi:hypothetical protein MKW98_009580 [Papaver atlanticum]|uniref:Uncharacterized protein n=1 Tax=Papaver atlanticum TaxID=357466 RepID=A0AAD4XC98_9MAGN|nr:hypothetical protein MKW98_009580 [Papaver atlanticum]
MEKSWLHHLTKSYSSYTRFSEFGVNGGPAAKALKPKYELFTNHLTSNLGFKFQISKLSIWLQLR